MTEARLHHFLIVFDHEQRRPVGRIARFDDAVTASDAYAAAERQYADASHIEVVLLGSDSVATLRRTHPNYFPQEQTRFAGRLEKYLVAHS